MCLFACSCVYPVCAVSKGLRGRQVQELELSQVMGIGTKKQVLSAAEPYLQPGILFLFLSSFLLDLACTRLLIF